VVQSWISGSMFASKCAGKQITIRFTFIIEGTPIDYPFTWVTFQGPDHFIIHSRPRTPRVFSAPDKKSK
jgi:hypothetical protein